MIKYSIRLIMSFVLVSSCVSKKIYTELEDKYTTLKKAHRDLNDANAQLTTTVAQLETDIAHLKTVSDSLAQERHLLASELATTKTSLKHLKASYKALEENSSASIAANAKKNRDLLAQLEAKEQALAQESKRLNALQSELQKRSQRIAELEKVIAAKDAAMTKLKNTISEALTNYKGKGLTVEQREGKVYVSMENKLLFESGSWFVGTEGRKAVKQLGSVLANNPDIAIRIEGHTDNVPYNGNTHLSGNWDLSTKRATAIVHILRENKAIHPENLTAAGRGEHAPVATNDTKVGRAKNRRIEVILTPKLDDISELLKTL